MGEFISNNRIAIIGCGIFGALAAIRLGEAGYKVEVFEEKALPLSGATRNNLNRVHLGPHYPRDIDTAKQSLNNFDRFCLEFKPAINKNFTNGYFIAKENSKTSPEDFIKFLDSANIPYEEVNPSKFPLKLLQVSMGIICKEAVYDINILRELLISKMDAVQIKLNCLSKISNINIKNNGFELELNNSELKNFDIVINSSYQNINRLYKSMQQDDNLGREFQYEYTASALIDLDITEPVGATIMDGPFVTLLPFGITGKYLLYDVEKSVLKRSIAEFMPNEWGNLKTTPVANISEYDFSMRLIKSALKFIPSLSKARVHGLMHGPRMVLSGKDSSDARPSYVSEVFPGYFEIFSGKVDHAIETGEKLLDLIRNKL